MDELLRHYDRKIEAIENKQRISIEIVKTITHIGEERAHYEILCKHMKKIMKFDEYIQKYLNKKKKKAEQQKGSANNGTAPLSKEQRLRQVAHAQVKRLGATSGSKKSSSSASDVVKYSVKRFGAGWAGAAVAMGFCF